MASLAAPIPATMTTSEMDAPGLTYRTWIPPALVLLAALAMGASTIRGSFVGADDYRLVLNHVLVNHPSWSHALQLFTIIHRDLYQPLPLLSFSAEFAVAGRLGLLNGGIEDAAWFFHLTNIMLHALNAGLVYVLIRALHRSDDHRAGALIAAVAGVLFAVHPLQVEVVAWLNGRMMLLSTLFALLSLLGLRRWFRTPTPAWGAAVILAGACCMMSKVRVEWPLLLLIVPLACRLRLTRRFAVLWLVCAAVTAAFTVVNYHATEEAGMFEGAVRNLRGPNAIRALRSLGWYFEHLVWPVGLASWYPAPTVVAWADAAALRAAAVVLPVVGVALWSIRRARPVALGFTWFFCAIASTVQLVPTRNTLAADRYMYLPIIGLLWVIGIGFEVLCRRLTRRSAARPALLVAGGSAVALLLGVSWHVASFYDNQVLKSERIAHLFPTTGHVWERAAWAYYREGRYDEAMAAARREFALDDQNAQSDAWEVIGASLREQKRYGEALDALNRSLSLDPQNVAAMYRMAGLLEDMGRHDEALDWYERAVREAPLKNPWINRLASVYRQRGRPADARGLYEQALRNNPYEVPAILGLAELDIEQGGPQSSQAAITRLEGLLRWMPENPVARINLGAAYAASGQAAKAVAQYREVLGADASNATAAINLAQLLDEAGEVDEAEALFEGAVDRGNPTLDELLAIHDFFVARQAAGRAAAVWSRYLARFPESVTAKSLLRWARALDGKVGGPPDCAELPSPPANADPGATAGTRHREWVLACAAGAYDAFAAGRFGAAARCVESLLGAGAMAAPLVPRLLAALEFYDSQHPDVAWTYCLTARLLLAQGRRDAAPVFIDLCARHCTEESCSAYINRLREVQESAPRTPPASSGR
ncbi:MAG: tetratricopeptide repeat protein [Planctomycetes bacterium]|nr:tetratricopeptide repeat protein [Planctomycetota bacterium]